MFVRVRILPGHAVVWYRSELLKAAAPSAARQNLIDERLLLGLFMIRRLVFLS